MDATRNKQLLQQIFEGLAAGDSSLLVASMADDFCWTVTGSTAWSGTYRGKHAVLNDLLAVLRAKIVDRVRTIARRFIADGDYVVVEARGNNSTKSGGGYNNAYCFVFRLAEGRLQEVTEYMDTELVTSALGSRTGG